MSGSCSWMYKRLDENGFISNEFTTGVQGFVDFALSQPAVVSLRKIQCPCSRCCKSKFQNVDTVRHHLCENGFTNGYFKWNHHGEKSISHIAGSSSDLPESDNTNSYRDMINDAMGPSVEVLDEVRVDSQSGNPIASRFFELLRDANEPLWDGCNKHTKLSTASWSSI